MIGYDHGRTGKSLTAPHREDRHMRPRSSRRRPVVLVLALLASLTSVAPAAASPVWNMQASMAVARAEATTTVLDSGKVLVTGGMQESYAYIDPDLGFTTDEVEFASAE